MPPLHPLSTQEIAIWAAVGAVGLLLLVFAGQLMAELRKYGILLRGKQMNEARDQFFFSFTGSWL